MRIRISAHWDTPQNILNRLLMQFKTDDINLTNVEFVFDDSYDIAIFFNYLKYQKIKRHLYFLMSRFGPDLIKKNIGSLTARF